MEEWLLDTGEQIDVIYTDYSKTFDTVSHRKLLKKLYRLGICESVWFWINDFFGDRKQKVRVNDSLSDWENVIVQFRKDLS